MRQNGENFESYTMKKPKVSDLKIDASETARIRKMAAKVKAVKITINIDAGNLATLKKEAERTGIPYQRLLNQVLKEALGDRESSDARLEKLEREVALMKRKLAA